MGLHEIEAWGAWSPWPMEEGEEGPIVFLPSEPAHFSTKPKKVTSWRTCPECGSRATKILSLNAKDPEKPYHCQVCRKDYAPPPPEARLTRRSRGHSHAWWFA